MKNLLKATCVVLTLLVIGVSGGGPAFAGSKSPTSTWNDSWAPDQLDPSSAIAAERARKKGYGPANRMSTTNIDTYTVYEEHNGDETSSNSTNVNNLNETNINAGVGDNSDGVIIDVVTGSTQNSETTEQGANAQSGVSDEGANTFDATSTNNSSN